MTDESTQAPVEEHAEEKPVFRRPQAALPRAGCFSSLRWLPRLAFSLLTGEAQQRCRRR